MLIHFATLFISFSSRNDEAKNSSTLFVNFLTLRAGNKIAYGKCNGVMDDIWGYEKEEKSSIILMYESCFWTAHKPSNVSWVFVGFSCICIVYMRNSWGRMRSTCISCRLDVTRTAFIGPAVCIRITRHAFCVEVSTYFCCCFYFGEDFTTLHVKSQALLNTPSEH